MWDLHELGRELKEPVDQFSREQKMGHGQEPSAEACCCNSAHVSGGKSIAVVAKTVLSANTQLRYLRRAQYNRFAFSLSPLYRLSSPVSRMLLDAPRSAIRRSGSPVSTDAHGPVIS